MKFWNKKGNDIYKNLYVIEKNELHISTQRPKSTLEYPKKCNKHEKQFFLLSSVIIDIIHY